MNTLTPRLSAVMDRCGFNEAEIADLLSTSPATVNSWVGPDARPTGPPVVRLIELLEIFDRLQEAVGPEGVREWIYAGSDELDGREPAGLIRLGEGHLVIDAVKRLPGVIHR